MVDEQTDTEPRPDHRYERLRALPPSAKLVHFVLDVESPLTQDELHEQTRLPARTVRYALTRLDEAALITKNVSLRDARRHRYSAKPVTRPEEPDRQEADTTMGE